MTASRVGDGLAFLPHYRHNRVSPTQCKFLPVMRRNELQSAPAASFLATPAKPDEHVGNNATRGGKASTERVKINHEKLRRLQPYLSYPGSVVVCVCLRIPCDNISDCQGPLSTISIPEFTNQCLYEGHADDEIPVQLVLWALSVVGEMNAPMSCSKGNQQSASG